MPINKCRICGNNFFAHPLLRYVNVPRAAQFFPDQDALKGEKGIVLGVYQCSGCGLVQLNNKPVSYYKEVVRAVAFSDEMQDFRRKQFRNFVEKYALKKKKIIEIGCGGGEYLSIMRQFTSGTYGLEYSPSAVKECVKNGLKVSRGFIGDRAYKLTGAPFDAFFTLNFLEHLPQLNASLRGIHNNLVEGAVGLVEVPNFDMILRKRLFSEFICDHLFYFTKETLATTLRLNGFEIVMLDEIRQDYSISAIVKKTKRLAIARFYSHQAQVKKEIQGYLRCFKRKRVAIWGAGHQALTVISLAELSGKISYVIDSAEFKQGKFTPVTHLPILSPAALKSNPPDEVIVMAESYSDEVARIIRQRFSQNIGIAILRDFGLEIIRGSR